jgi:hypothetical protein
MHSARHVALMWNQELATIPAESASAPSARADIHADAAGPREGEMASESGVEGGVIAVAFGLDSVDTAELRY